MYAYGIRLLIARTWTFQISLAVRRCQYIPARSLSEILCNFITWKFKATSSNLLSAHLFLPYFTSYIFIGSFGLSLYFVSQNENISRTRGKIRECAFFSGIAPQNQSLFRTTVGWTGGNKDTSMFYRGLALRGLFCCESRARRRATNKTHRIAAAAAARRTCSSQRPRGCEPVLESPDSWWLKRR